MTHFDSLSEIIVFKLVDHLASFEVPTIDIIPSRGKQYPVFVRKIHAVDPFQLRIWDGLFVTG